MYFICLFSTAFLCSFVPTALLDASKRGELQKVSCFLRSVDEVGELIGFNNEESKIFKIVVVGEAKI